MSGPGVATVTVLIVPGLRDHVPGHWQTILEEELPKAACVPRLGRDNLSCEAWVAAVDGALAAIDGPVVLAAHSAGVIMVAHWAARHSRPIRGALLATPPDLETPLPQGYPTLDALRANGWMPAPRARLPFPSVVVASRNDPLARFDCATELARDWGSRVVDAGEVGHLNPAAGFGRWDRALGLVDELSRA